MKLVYIHHSGFAVLGTGFTCIIDYYTEGGKEGIISGLLSDRPGPFYVLVSHAHADHFNPEILLWQEQRPDIRYVFSADVRKRVKDASGDIRFLRKGEIWEDRNIRIKAYGSTDVGISFLIDAEQKRIFHAGDLNNWHWEEESTAAEVKKYEADFLRELSDLARDTEYVDLAMFPVDPRLGKDYMRGARQFVDRIRTSWFAPMHFWQHYELANAFREYAENKGCCFAAWTHPGQSIDF